MKKYTETQINEVTWESLSCFKAFCPVKTIAARCTEIVVHWTLNDAF